MASRFICGYTGEPERCCLEKTGGSSSIGSGAAGKLRADCPGFATGWTGTSDLVFLATEAGILFYES